MVVWAGTKACRDGYPVAPGRTGRRRRDATKGPYVSGPPGFSARANTERV
jgi:hypothetical protein